MECVCYSYFLHTLSASTLCISSLKPLHGIISYCTWDISLGGLFNVDENGRGLHTPPVKIGRIMGFKNNYMAHSANIWYLGFLV